MKTWTIQLRLFDDAVISERAATAGGHASLDYVPGSVLLGVAASRLYADLGDEAWTVFHTGRVRFGAARPDVSGMAAMPMPLAWHHEKGQPFTKQSSGAALLIGEQLTNLAQASYQQLEGRQFKQVRDGYVSPYGHWITPLKRVRMKTAIDPEHGRAADAQLFGYEAIAAGTTLSGRLAVDDDVADEIAERIVTVFNGRIHIGRSRSAEYGRADVQTIEHAEPSAWWGEYAGRKALTLWLATDLAAVDAFGTPTLAPSPTDLGLPSGRLDPAKSFIRSRRYAPYNAFRRAHDVERVVITAGSVLHFDLDEPLAPEHSEHLQHGLGLWRECGLGEVVANPPALETIHPTFDVSAASGDREGIHHAAPDHPVIDWLQARSQGMRRADVLKAQVAALARDYRDALVTTRRRDGLKTDEMLGPTPSQFSSIAELAARPRWRAETLFDDGPCSPSRENWGTEIVVDAGTKTVSEWFREAVNRQEGSAEFVQRLARALAKEASTRALAERSESGVSS